MRETTISIIIITLSTTARVFDASGPDIDNNFDNNSIDNGAGVDASGPDIDDNFDPGEISDDPPGETDPSPQNPTDAAGDADTGEVAAGDEIQSEPAEILTILQAMKIFCREDPSSDDDMDFGADEIFEDFDSYSDGSYWDLPPEYYENALQNLEAAIQLDPDDPDLYLERGVAYFELGDYERSIADYSQFVEKKDEPLSMTDFTIGFARGLPKGIYASGEGTLFFLSEFITHPVQTSVQVIDSIGQLVTLVKNDEYGVVAESLSPELHQLVTEWETLSSEKKRRALRIRRRQTGNGSSCSRSDRKNCRQKRNGSKRIVSDLQRYPIGARDSCP